MFIERIYTPWVAPSQGIPPVKGVRQRSWRTNSPCTWTMLPLVPLGLCVGGGACLFLFIVLYGGADLLMYVGVSAVSAVLGVGLFDFVENLGFPTPILCCRSVVG
jgi:hypothetical protein